MNLIAPHVVGPAEAWDVVAEQVPVAGAELVGLVPAAVLDRTDPARWSQLDLAHDRHASSPVWRGRDRATRAGVCVPRTGGTGRALAIGRRRARQPRAG